MHWLLLLLFGEWLSIDAKVVHRLGASDAHQHAFIVQLSSQWTYFMLPVDNPICVCVFSTTVSDVNENWRNCQLFPEEITGVQQLSHS